MGPYADSCVPGPRLRSSRDLPLLKVQNSRIRQKLTVAKGAPLLASSEVGRGGLPSGPWSRSTTGLMIGSIFFGRNFGDWIHQITFKTDPRKCLHFSRFFGGRSFFLDPNNLTIKI